MRKTIEIMLTVPFDVEVEREDDDDGAGSPSVTGNSMTGKRGSFWAIKSVTFDGTAEKALAAINAALDDCKDDLDANDYAPE